MSMTGSFRLRADALASVTRELRTGSRSLHIRSASLIEATEASRDAALNAVRVRHDLVRDAIIAAAAREKR